ncbi:probable 26S proteasome complex subunit sem1 [Drosophila miranda]|uniref:probable 26S proteasome complex subunit sem1 n=1 Tax=Drosophila miranda TaxID=7229 RepID=UPI0007E845E7|nr:probable 26S proteasome complex subunit sem1 [Drosophila miranda]
MLAPDKEKEKEKEEATNKGEDLGLLEEDDEFEEFPAEDFRVGDDEEELNVWEDNWDDDNVEDDFSQQLKAHLESKKMET